MLHIYDVKNELRGGCGTKAENNFLLEEQPEIESGSMPPGTILKKQRVHFDQSHFVKNG